MTVILDNLAEGLGRDDIPQNYPTLDPPSQIEGGSKFPGAGIARSATTVRAVGRGTPSKPVTAREELRRWRRVSQWEREGTELLKL